MGVLAAHPKAPLCKGSNQYATPFSLEENGVARQKNFEGTCAAAVVSASLSLAEQERRVDGALWTVVVIALHPVFPGHGTRICYPVRPRARNARPYK